MRTFTKTERDVLGEASGRGRRYLHWATFLLALVLPLSIYRPVAPSIAPKIVDDYVRPGLYLSDLVIGVLFAYYIAQRRAHGARWGDRRLTVPLAGLVLLAAMTAPAAKSPPLAVYYALRWLWAACLYLFIVEGDVPIEDWAMVFLAGLSIQALVGVGQVLHQGPLGLPGELALEPARTGASILEVHGQRWLRAYGLTFHPNVLGGFLVVGILLALPLLRSWRVRLVWWVLVLGLLLTFSRSAWLATAVTLPPLAGWLLWRKASLRTPIALTFAGAALLALLGGLLLEGQFQTRTRPSATVSESRSLDERAELIAIALNIITDRPLVGVGAGNFPLITLEAGRPVGPQPVHNVPILLAAEVGIIGAALWFWLWLRPGIALENLWRRDEYWPVVLIAAGFAVGVIGLWDDYPWALESGRLLTVTVLAFISRALSEV